MTDSTGNTSVETSEDQDLPKFTLEGVAKVKKAVEEILKGNIPLHLPMAGRRNIEKMLLELADMEKDESLADVFADPSYEEWKRAVSLAVDALPKDEVYEKNVEEGDWSIGFTQDGKYVGMSSPKANSSMGKNLVGKEATLQVQSILGLGTINQTPLWHSGIWVKFKAPSDSRQHILEQTIALDKITMGRASSGLTFSNSSAFMKRWLVEFALEHVYAHNVALAEGESLADYILCTDYALLLHGILCTMYPKGYPLVQPCTSKVSDCKHVEKATISLPRLSWTDRSKMTEEQKLFMSDRTTVRSTDDILNYQKDGNFYDMGIHELAPGFKAHIKVPSLTKYITEGTTWIDGIEDLVKESFGKQLSTKERNIHMIDHSKATSLRSYGHWVDSILLGDEGNENIIDDINTLRNTLSTSSRSAEVKDKMRKVIDNAISKSTFSLIAIPAYDCPACKKPSDSTHETYGSLIPLEIEYVFFTLTRSTLLKNSQVII